MPFAYFGSKHGLARYYPPPALGTIIEPFAGAAGYSVYWARAGQRVRLYDKDPAVVALWETLMGASCAEVLADCEEQLSAGQATHPFLTMLRGSGPLRVIGEETAKVNDWMRVEWEKQKRRIALALPRIQSDKWSIECRSYEEIENRNAVWFIDPPYKPYTTNAGNEYREGASGIDYSHLATWCRERIGQVIVCEQQPADWLPFRPFRRQNAQSTSTTGGERRVEILWSKTPGSALGRTPFAVEQKRRAADRKRSVRKDAAR
jgi:site-specific DNA-adenine methylase